MKNFSTIRSANTTLAELNLQWRPCEPMTIGEYRSMLPSELKFGPAFYKFNDEEEVAAIYIFDISWRTRDGISYAFVSFIGTESVQKIGKQMSLHQYREDFDSNFMVKS